MVTIRCRMPCGSIVTLPSAVGQVAVPIAKPRSATSPPGSECERGLAQSSPRDLRLTRFADLRGRIPAKADEPQESLDLAETVSGFCALRQTSS